MKDITRLLPLVIDTALKAGKEIMEVYQTTFKVELKDDRTPLTLADKKSHEVIEANLSAYFPLLSEEGKSVPFEERLNWERFWMVDPLDGTKEFLKRNNEFTVNIALIENGIPVMGVVYAPALNRFYYAEKQTGSFRFIWQGAETPDVNAILSKAVKLPLELSVRPYTVVASRSHLSPETESFVEKLRSEHGQVEFISSGSSLKLCLVAEGSADVYPRLAPTMEWDTAAGHAIALYAGKSVSLFKSGDVLPYNKPELLNEWFVVK